MLFRSASRSLTVAETVDRFGQAHPIKGQGFKHTGVYEHIAEDTRRTIFIRDPAGFVVWQAKRHNTLDQVREFRDDTFPDCTLCVWEGGDDGHFVLIDHPRSTPLAQHAHAPIPPKSKGKAKRHRNRIRRAT